MPTTQDPFDIPNMFKRSGKLSPEQIQAIQDEMVRLAAENAALKAKPTNQRTLTWKASEKGAISIYGLGKFPVTLYKSQWDKLYPVMNEIEAWRQENDDKLTNKA